MAKVVWDDHDQIKSDEFPFSRLRLQASSSLIDLELQLCALLLDENDLLSLEKGPSYRKDLDKDTVGEIRKRRTLG